MEPQTDYSIQLIQLKGRNKDMCEDEALICRHSMHSEGLFFAALADGQSQQPHCAEGARCALHTVYRYILSNGVTPLSRRYSDEICYEILRNVRQNLLNLAQKSHADVAQYASTLCCFACDTHSGDFMLIHLGDGCVLGLTSDAQLRMLCCPDHSITSNHTCLSTSPNAISHLRLSWGNCRNYDAFYLMTDGASCICRDGWVLPRARPPLLHLQFSRLREQLSRSHLSDDASLMMILP